MESELCSAFRHSFPAGGRGDCEIHKSIDDEKSLIIHQLIRSPGNNCSILLPSNFRLFFHVRVFFVHQATEQLNLNKAT